MKSLLIALAIMFPIFSSAETLIVRFKEDRVSAFATQVRAKARAQVLQGKIVVVDGKYEAFHQNPDVLYVERNVRYHVYGYGSPSTSIKDANSAWGIAKIQASTFWARGYKGKGVRVAVIDTGVDGTHPEINGKVEAGFNAIDGSVNAMDDMCHGTHVSGTIAGNTVGVAPEATIVPVKFLDSQGSGSLEGAVKAIDWATQQNVQIMSASWGGSDDSQALKDIVKAATDKGILFVAAAGNDGADNDQVSSFPSNYPGVIAVAASDQSDALASFSNFGLKSVLLAAPGVGIYSSLPGGQYAAWDGTSMATPHVSGALALLLSSGCKKGAKCLSKEYAALPAFKGKVVTGGRLELK